MRKFLLSLVAILTFVGLAHADEYVFMSGAANNNYTGSAPSTLWETISSDTPQLVSSNGFITVKGNNNTYFASGYLKVFNNATLRFIPAQGKKITKITFGCYNATYCNTFVNNANFDQGSAQRDGDLLYVWTGEATATAPLNLRTPESSASFFINYFIVEYSDIISSGGDDNPEPEDDDATTLIINSRATSKYTGDLPILNLPEEDALPATYSAIKPGVLTLSWDNSNISWQKNVWTGAMSYFIVLSKGGQFTLTPNAGVTIKKVTFYASNCQRDMAASLIPSSGEMSKLDGTSGYNAAVWNGSASGALTFVNNATADLNYIKYIEVEYEKQAATGEKVATPEISPAAGSYKVGQLVSISSEEGTTILYSATQDGSEKWLDYSAPFALDNVGNWTVKARAYKGATASEDAVADYTIEYLDVATPSISPASGSYAAGQLITISGADADRFEYSATTDGSENWQAYNEPFALNTAGTWTVKARAYVGISPSPVATATFTIAKSVANLSFPKEAYNATLTQAFAAPALSNPNNLPVVWASSNTAVATVDNGNVTTLAAGETTITASFAGNDAFEAGNASYTLTVNRLTPSLTFTADNAECVIGQQLTVPTLNNPTERPILWSSSNPAVATVDAVGSVRVQAPGVTVITASTEQTELYNATSASFTVTVFRTDAPVSQASAQVVVQDYYKINYLSYSAVQTEAGAKSYDWKNFTFRFGPESNNVFLNSNYTTMSGSSKPSCVYMPNGGDMTISAPVGATMTKVVINLSDNQYVSKVFASEGSITPQVKGDNSVVWTGNAKSVKFTISSDNQFGTKDSGFGRLYMSSFDIDYEQKLSPAAPIIYANYNGETYLNDAAFDADVNTTLNVNAPDGYTSMTCDTYYLGGGQADLRRFYEGNVAALPLKLIGKYKYVFTAYKDENADPITAEFKVTVLGQPNPAVGTFDFTPTDAYNMPICQLGEFENSSMAYTLKSGDVQLFIPEGQKTGHVSVEDVCYLEVEKGSWYVLRVPADRRIVSVQFAGLRAGAQQGCTVPDANDNFSVIGSMDTEALWTAPVDANDVRTIAFRSNNYYNDDPVLISSITVNTNVQTIVFDLNADEDAEYFTLNGVKVAGHELTPGIYIVRTNGVTRKVVVK